MFVAFFMSQRLIKEINYLQKEVMKKTTELSQYQKYAGVLGGSSILGLNNLAGLSSKVLPRASLFAQYSDQASSMSAMQNLQAMKMMGRVPWTGNQLMQMQIEQSAFRQFKEQAMKELKRQEVAVMNEKEAEIQLELNSMQQRLKMKEAQLQNYQQLASKQASEMAPNFGLG